MRKIFPLKSASSASSNQPNGHQQQSAGSGSAATTSQREGLRPKPVGGSSRYAPELSKKITTARTKKGDTSTSDDANPANLKSGTTKREHWCPSCPAAENGMRCATPPSGDENLEGKEGEEKVVIVVPSSNSLPAGTSQRRRSAHDDVVGDADERTLNHEHLKGDVSDTMRGADICPVLVDKYPSKRSGLGAVENVLHGRLPSKPGAKPKSANAAATVYPPLPQATAEEEETPRSTSAPKGRAISRSGPPDGPRVHSMRITRVPDRVFDAAAAGRHNSGYLPRLASDLSTSTDSGTPRTSRAAAAAAAAASERQRQLNLPLVNTHSRPQSFNEGANGGKPPVNSPSAFGRSKPNTDSPRLSKKDAGPPVPWGASGTESLSVEKGGPQNKYSGARVVAERLAKAFRGTSKAKEGRSLTDTSRKTTLGESRRMSLEQQQISDCSYDGSCSETSSLHASAEDKMLLANALPLPRAEDVHSQSSRKEKVISAEEEHVLTWQEFVSGARTPSRRLSNDDKQISEKAMVSNPRQVSKNLGPTSESRRWNSSAQEESKNSVGRQQLSGSQQEEKEREILKAWLEGLKKQSDGMNDDLEMKARLAEQRLSMLNGEQSLYDDQLEFLHELQMKDDNGKGSLAAGITVMQQRIRRMHEEKKRLALEVASEVKRRITERAAAKEVLVMMKREMEACVRVMEKEKMGIQSGLQRELERREGEWVAKLDDAAIEEKSLRDRLGWLEEEKAGLQGDLASAGLKQSSFRGRVKEFEIQMEGHRKRVEGAEQTILDLRHSLVSSCQQARQAENDLDLARKMCAEKETESRELTRQVAQLQERCASYESNMDSSHQALKNGTKGNSADSKGGSPESMKKELVRLRVIEKSLREELELSKKENASLQAERRASSEKVGNAELETELTNLHLRTVQLQDENSVLSLDVQQAVEERDHGKEALSVLESKLSEMEGASKGLQDEIGREKNRTQEKEREIHRLERRVDGLLKNNQMLQGILAMREKAAVLSDEEVKEKDRAITEAHHLEAEMRESLQVSARQLSFMSERAELMNEKLQEREALLTALKNDCGKKDETIRSLEHSLGDLAKSVDAQNRRIMHLTSKNGELSRHLQARGKEIEDLHLKVVEDNQSRMNCSQEIDQLSVQSRDIKQELESQDLLCKLLRDKLSQREDDLSKRSDEVASLIRGRDWLQSELKRTQNSLADASERLASLERTVRQNGDLMSSLKAEKDAHVRDLANLRDLLPRVEQERDEIQEEAEEIGREALRMSAEVEVLRRKVAQLEEDVMVKEGQISILRGSCFGATE